MKDDLRNFVEHFSRELAADNAAILAGTGLSSPAGFVDWRNLLRPIARELDLDIDMETDLVAVAQFHVNGNGMNRSQLNQAILDAFGPESKPTRNHHLLAMLPISTFWTTNYDKLIEQALTKAGKIVDTKHSIKQLSQTRARRDAVVYKMHGDVEHSHDAILTKDDYERYPRSHGAFVNALSGDLVSKTFLFIGFSFTDPNLDYILSRIRVTFREHARRHYAFFKVRTRQAGESDMAFANAKVRQTLMIQDLKRFNITTLLVDDYDEITEVLEELVRRYRSGTLFVSASAAHFEPWGEDAVAQFMRTLGGTLLDQGLRIATGLGLGVGNALLTGVLEQVYRDRRKHVEDAILVRPFPQYIADAATRQTIWREYRQDIISHAGIALFLFGNKEQDGGTVDANGMLEEFEIAAQNGLVLLPIGATGSVSAVFAQRALDEPDRYLASLSPSARALVARLARPTNDLMTLIEPIKWLIEAVK